MKRIRVLAIGTKDWIDNLDNDILNKLEDIHTLEIISNEEAALERLTHNSYDILILQDKFSPVNSIHLATLAYAMTRPTLILCDSKFKVFKYLIWKFLSVFARKYKTSKKLIFFKHYNSNYLDLISFLAKNHLQYFEQVNKEIKENTSNID
jgi:hypothetical protein